jgi:hypothetical protein
MRGMFAGFLLLSCLSLSAFADSTVKPVLNKVQYQLSNEAWVTTKTAEVIISVNATLNENGLGKAHNDILNKLNEIAKSDWHITQFNRSPNESGLEQLQVLAQTRLSETSLSDLREQAKKVSKPGETYKIENIAFEPTLSETEAVRGQLRNQVYQQIQNELSQLNKIYPNQHYIIHDINFMENVSPQPRPRVMMLAATENSPTSAPVEVANKMTVTANVVLVSINQ